MNIRFITSTTAAAALTMGLALPVSALSLNGAVNAVTGAGVQTGQTQATGSVSGSADVSQSAQTDTNADASVSGNAGLGAGITGVVRSILNSAKNAGASSDVSARIGSDTTGAVGVVITRQDLNLDTQPGVDATLVAHIKAAMQADSNVAQVEATADTVAVTYKEPAKFLGFLPVSINTTAIVTANGDVAVSHPWYAFLFTTTDAGLQAQLQDRVDIVFNTSGSANTGVSGQMGLNNGGGITGVHDGKGYGSLNTGVSASTSASVAATFSSDIQARVIDEVRAAMAAYASASANASASGQVQTQ